MKQINERIVMDTERSADWCVFCDYPEDFCGDNCDALDWEINIPPIER